MNISDIIKDFASIFKSDDKPGKKEFKKMGLDKPIKAEEILSTSDDKGQPIVQQVTPDINRAREAAEQSGDGTTHKMDKEQGK